MKNRWSVPAPVATALLATTAVLSLSLAGCASTPVPNEQLAVANAAVVRASSTSTSESAPAELSIAVNKLAAARSATASGDQDRARRLAEQVVVDAQVAELHAQAVRSRKAAQESEEAARVLREELSRKKPS